MKNRLENMKQIQKRLERIERLAEEIKELEPSFVLKWSLTVEGAGGSEQVD